MALRLAPIPFAHEVQCTVQARLPAHRRQQGVRPLALDDPGNDPPLDRLDVDRVRGVRVGHDRCRIGIDQHHAKPVLA
jgi:hypothetical protein